MVTNGAGDIICRFRVAVVIESYFIGRTFVWLTNVRPNPHPRGAWSRRRGALTLVSPTLFYFYKLCEQQPGIGQKKHQRFQALNMP